MRVDRRNQIAARRGGASRAPGTSLIGADASWEAALGAAGATIASFAALTFFARGESDWARFPIVTRRS